MKVCLFSFKFITALKLKLHTSSRGSKHGACVPQEWKYDTKSLIPDWCGPGYKSWPLHRWKPPGSCQWDVGHLPGNLCWCWEWSGCVAWTTQPQPVCTKDSPNSSVTPRLSAIVSDGQFHNGDWHQLQVAGVTTAQTKPRKLTRCSCSFLNNRKLKLSAEGSLFCRQMRTGELESGCFLMGLTAKWPFLWKTSSCLHEWDTHVIR